MKTLTSKKTKTKMAYAFGALAGLVFGTSNIAIAQSSAFSKTENAALSGHNTKKLTHKSVRQCMNACLSESSFSCKSFDYAKAAQSCDLSDTNASDVGGLKTNYPGNPYDHYSLLEVVESPTFGRGIEEGPQVPDVLYAVKQMQGRNSIVVDTKVSGFTNKYDANVSNSDHVQGITMTSTGRIVVSVSRTKSSTGCGGVLMYSSVYRENSDIPLTWETYCSANNGLEKHPSSIQAVGEIISVGTHGGSRFYHLPQNGKIQRLAHLDTSGGRDASGVTYNKKEDRFYSLDGAGSVKPGQRTASICRTNVGVTLLDAGTSFKDCKLISTYISGQGSSLLTQADGQMFVVSTFSSDEFYPDGSSASEGAKSAQYIAKCTSDGADALFKGYSQSTPYSDVLYVSKINYAAGTSRLLYKGEIGRTQRVQTCVTDRPAFRFAGGVAPFGTKGELMGLWSGRFLTAVPKAPNSDSFEFAAQNLTPRGVRTEHYSVAIDCDVDGISDEGTKNTITATFYNDRGEVVGVGREVGVVGGVFGCGLEDLDIRATTTDRVKKVKISTDGSDGFMIDKIELREAGRIVRTFGSNNDKGWCLSTDPMDGSNNWKEAAGNQCKSEYTWSYEKSESKSTREEHYSVAIDCDVDGIQNEGTEDTITATFYDAKGKIIGVGKEHGVVGGVFGCGLEDLDIHATTRGQATRVKISTSGSDGFMIDKIELRKDGKVLRSYGANNDKGWCLSTDPMDGSRTWKTAASGKCEAEYSWNY